jgi:tetratricopeptide (TPR) repeat protein
MKLLAGNIINVLFIALIISAASTVLFPESIRDIDKRAEQYYENKELNKAIAEWLSILEIDPDNDEVQKKIESVYDEKHRKDSAKQTALIQLRLAKKVLDTDLKESNRRAEISWNNFVIAYRIDPNDMDLLDLKEDMREFRKSLEIENRKKRLSEAMRQRYIVLLPMARDKMKKKDYEEALKIWNELLTIVPLDTTSNEGKRQAELAIQNRLKFEKIMALMESGINLFNQTKYTEARLEFDQVLALDSKNKDAKSYIEKIKDILEENRNRELVGIQAEQFYASGIDNLKKKNFDMAKEDFNNVLSLIENYRDVPERLRSIDRLRREYDEQQRIGKLRQIDQQFESGLLALTEGRYKDAVVALEAVLTLDPPNLLAKKYIQTAKEALEQIEEEIVTEDSPYFSVVNSLEVSGKVLYEKGEYTESRRRWEKILDLFPKNRMATEYLLRCNLKINPDFFNDFAKRSISEGRNLLKEKKYREALLRFELIKSVSINYPGIDDLIAVAKVSAKKKAAPVNNVSPEEIAKRIKTGIDYYTKGGADNIKLALQEFRWVSANDPENNSALIYMNRIESQLRVGVVPAAKAGRLTDKQEQLARTYYFKGINYYFNNRFDDAISEWRKVLAIDPDHEKAKMNIRKCLVLLKR